MKQSGEMTCSMWLRQKVREPEFEPEKSERWSQDPHPGSPTLWWLQDSYPHALPLKPVCFTMWNEAQWKNNLILRYLYWLFTVQMYSVKAFNKWKSVYLKNKYCFKKGGTCFPPSFLHSINMHECLFTPDTMWGTGVTAVTKRDKNERKQGNRTWCSF